jgi:hypothetical protein
MNPRGWQSLPTTRRNPDGDGIVSDKLTMRNKAELPFLYAIQDLIVTLMHRFWSFGV